MRIKDEQALKDQGWMLGADNTWYKSLHKDNASAPYVCVQMTDPPKPPKRIRQSTKPLMNKLESEWFEVLKVRHKIVVPQSLRFMLANGVWYKPDFIAWPCGFESQDIRMRAFECKGNKGKNIDRGKLVLKLAANRYPQIKWVLVWRDKDTNQWQEQTILP